MQSVSALVVRAPLICPAQVRSGLRLLHDGARFGSSKISAVPRNLCSSAERGGNNPWSIPFRRQRGAMTGARAQNGGDQQPQQHKEEQQEGRGIVRQKQGNGRGITRQPLGGGGLLSPMLERSILRTPFEMQRDEDAYHLRVDMPGLSKDEVKLQVEDGNILYIKGEHSEEKKQDQRFARSYGTYQTRLVLEEDADVTKIDAELKDGVLLVTVPKKPEAKDRGKVIEVAIK